MKRSAHADTMSDGANMPETCGLEDACVADCGEWMPLPSWAHFYTDVGAAAASTRCADTRLVVGLAVPTRAYAAAFTALGVVLGAAESSGMDEEDKEYFEQLYRTRPGTSVRFFDEKAGRIKRGVLSGTDTVDGKRVLRIQVTRTARDTERRGGSQTYLVSMESARKITLADGENWQLSATQSGRRVSGETTLSGALLDAGKARRFVTGSSFDCAILGEASILRKEIKETRVAVGDPVVNGSKDHLQDVLRVRRFGGVGQPYRSRVIPTATWKRRASLKGPKPKVAVFDGAAAFLKWRDHWRESNWVVILDRTQRLFESAAATLNEAYAANRLRDASLKAIGQVPAGVELLAFEEAAG